MENSNPLTSKHILEIIHACSQRLNLDLDSYVLKETDKLLRHYHVGDIQEFIRDLTEMANGIGLVFIKKEVNRPDFELFIEQYDAPMILFLNIDDKITPGLIDTNSKRKKEVTLIQEGATSVIDLSEIKDEQIIKSVNEEIIFIAAFVQNSISGSDTDVDESKLTPVFRLFRLLASDKRDIFYVYVYAFIIGITSLVLPLGIQAAIELISGGVFISSVYFLIAIIIIGVLGAGILQILQITIVELLQRRVFTKAAFEFAYRVPRIKMTAIQNLHFPELMNRFFDVLTIQKGLPKILIDLSTGVIQIGFGLLLLSFYHPFFVFFGLALVSILFFIFFLTGPKGLESSIIESKFKYKVVYWMEEMARAIYSFKLSGTTDLPLRKTDYYVNNYLKNRKKHFSILITQYSYVLFFKAVVTAGLLIIGTFLVVEREITLGQFVASEVIIILILNSVEKIISYMDVVYDMLTAVDKIAHVTDLPLERTGGVDIEVGADEGFEIKAKNLSYTYEGANKPSISNISFNISKGERVCISGLGGSGKTTLINALSGLYTSFSGTVTYDKYSIRELDPIHIRDHIGKNVSTEDIFEGTIIDNILVGKPLLDEKSAIEALEFSGLIDEINDLPQGLHTKIMAGGRGFSETFIQRLVLARCVAKKPNLMILNDFFVSFPKQERLHLIEKLTNPDHKWTLIVVSNDPMVMAACDRVMYMSNGQIIANGSFNEVIQIEEVVQNLN